MTETCSIYDGAIKARKVGAFIMGGESFVLIRPGYDAQGKRRSSWTQVVHEGIPIYDFKIKGEVSVVTNAFANLFDKFIGSDRDILLKALSTCKSARRRKFRDGVTGETPAPTLTLDGPRTGHRYVK